MFFVLPIINYYYCMWMTDRNPGAIALYQCPIWGLCHIKKKGGAKMEKGPLYTEA